MSNILFSDSRRRKKKQEKKMRARMRLILHLPCWLTAIRCLSLFLHRSVPAWSNPMLRTLQLPLLWYVDRRFWASRYGKQLWLPPFDPPNFARMLVPSAPGFYFWSSPLLLPELFYKNIWVPSGQSELADANKMCWEWGMAFLLQCRRWMRQLFLLLGTP